MAEQSATEQIATQLATREAGFAAWFADSREDVTPEQVRELADQFDYTPSERDDDESADDYAERITDEATEFVVEKRDDENALDEAVLGISVSVTVAIRVDLSTGGPGDYLTADLDPSDGSIDNVLYHYAPWFDHAETSVGSDSPLYALVERFASSYEGMSIEDIQNS